MGIGDITDNVLRAIEDAADGFGEMLEPVVRIGVTGLSQAGKTVFITSLVANLLDRGRMQHLQAAAEGRITAAFLQPQPEDTIARFDYETHLAALTGPAPHWPKSTRTISQLRLSLKIRKGGMLAGLRGEKTLHIDIVDYPGEWLLDLPLLSQSFAEFSAKSLGLAGAENRSALATVWRETLDACDPTAQYDEVQAQKISSEFAKYLQECREKGYAGCAPGRMLLPGDLDGSPILNFSPLPDVNKTGSKSLYRTFERRFESYKKKVVKPFFRDHFTKIDRQVVLMDVLGAVHSGPEAVEDLRNSMGEILSCFRPGKNSWLSSIVSKRVEKILFAATKADHLHHHQHPKLSALTKSLLREAKDKADFKGASTDAIALASLRATVEKTVTHDGVALDAVQGKLSESGKFAAMFAGELPDDPAHLLVPARDGASNWLDGAFEIMRFAPPELNRREGEGLPHIRLDKATEFLIGDKL